MSNKVLVIGAQNIDLFAKTKETYELQDSNMCNMSIAYGGVGRNIAENLKRLHHDVSFLTVFSDDGFGQAAKQSLIDMNIDVSKSIMVKGYMNSIYLGILDKDNDLFLGLNDMKIVKELDVRILSERISYINSFDYIVIDNNLSEESITYLLDTITGIKIMDAVSAHKIHKIASHLDKIDYLKVNKIEYNQLIKEATISSNTNVIITDGENQIRYLSSDSLVVSPIKVDQVVNASGAGDGFISGFIHGLLLGATNKEKLEYAKKVAYYTLLSNDATNKELDKIEVTI